jgi:hypothetical protein
MTRTQFLANTDSAEITAWMALDALEHEDKHKRDLQAKADAALAARGKGR